MDRTLQRLGIWAAIPFMVVLGVAFVVIGGMVPPQSPTSTLTETTRFLVEHKLRIRVGVAVSALAAALLYPWTAAICLRVRAIEGKWGMLTVTEILTSAILVPSITYPMVVMAAAAFRPEGNPHGSEALRDLFWLSFVGPTGFVIAQASVLAIATFAYGGQPVSFPRWFGYLNIWYVIGTLPSAAVLLFNDGPLAWNGIIGFWIPLSAFGIWIIGITVALLRSIKADEQADLDLAPASA